MRSFSRAMAVENLCRDAWKPRRKSQIYLKVPATAQDSVNDLLISAPNSPEIKPYLFFIRKPVKAKPFLHARIGKQPQVYFLDHHCPCHRASSLDNIVMRKRITSEHTNIQRLSGAHLKIPDRCVFTAFSPPRAKSNLIFSGK